MKKRIAMILATSAVFAAASAREIDINVLADALANVEEFSAIADYKVLLPTIDEPILYTINMASSANAEDTLSTANYRLEWSLEKDGRRSDGFTVYFSGNLYSYRDKLLREYHYENEPEIFAPGNDASLGIQNQAQFTNLLPQRIAEKLMAMTCDTTYKYTVHADTVISRQKTIAVDGVRSYGGEVAQQFIYIFDRDLWPVSIEITNNPGQTGEQIITTTYNYGDETIAPVCSEAELSQLYPEAFSKYRERNFTFDNLPGRRLPNFSSPTPSGERYTFNKNSHFDRPTVIAIMDSDSDRSSELIAALRKKIDEMDEKSDLILAFVNNNADAIENIVGRARHGEHILMSARGLARDCGAKGLPAIIECDINGTVISATSQQ